MVNASKEAAKSESRTWRILFPIHVIALAMATSGCADVDAPGKSLNGSTEQVEIEIPIVVKMASIVFATALPVIAIWKRKRIFPVASILSTSLLFASSVLWQRSYSSTERVEAGFRTESVEKLDIKLYAIKWSRGGICCYTAAVRYEAGPAADSVTKHTFAEQRARPNPYFQWYRYPYLRYGPPTYKKLPQRAPHFWERFGFKVTSANLDTGYADATAPFTWSITAPFWFLALLFSILPACWLTRTVRRLRRKKAGHCPKCNYDLRASKDRCPECGTPIPTPPSPTPKPASPPAPPQPSP